MSKSLNVKICGLNNKETVEVAVKAGASHLGFIFHAKLYLLLGPLAKICRGWEIVARKKSSYRKSINV